MRGRRRQAEQVGQRVDRDQRRRAAHEAAQRRRRDEVGDRAEAQRADQELHRADEHGDGERERDVVGRADERRAAPASRTGRASSRWSAPRRRASSSRTAPRRCTERRRCRGRTRAAARRASRTRSLAAGRAARRARRRRGRRAALARSTRWIHDPKTRAASSFTAPDYRARGRRRSDDASVDARAAAARRRLARLSGAAARLGDVARERADLRVGQRGRDTTASRRCRSRSAAATRSASGCKLVERRADGAGRAGVLQGVAESRTAASRRR